MKKGLTKTMRKIILIVLVVLAGVCPVQAYPDKVFTSSGQINDGENWDNVNVYGDDTVVDMFDFSHTMGLTTHNGSTFNLYGGHVDRWLTATDNSTVNIYGGGCDILAVEDSAIINVHNVSFLDMSATGGRIYLYAYDVIHSPTEGGLGGGMLEGNLYLNDSYFRYDLYPGTYEYITVIPEPCSILLFGLGGVFFRKRN